MPFAVDQHESATDAQAPEVEQVEPGRADKASGVALAVGRAQRGQIVERVTEGQFTLIGKLTYVHGSHGDRRIKVRTRNAAAGYQDHIPGGRSVFSLLFQNVVARIGIGILRQHWRGKSESGEPCAAEQCGPSTKGGKGLFHLIESPTRTGGTGS